MEIHHHNYYDIEILLLLVPPPQIIRHQPIGTYGIAFDLLTRRMTDPPPDGWGLRSRGNIYNQIARLLNIYGYNHVQGSTYQMNFTLAVLTWFDMYSLLFLVEPLGLFSSVVGAIQMYYIPWYIPEMIATDDIQLGGRNAPILLAPTPRNLVPVNVPGLPMNMAPFPLPMYVADTPQANDPQNWLQ